MNIPAPENTMWDRDLLTAARGGHLNLAKTALEKGANINCYDYNQNTPLMLACVNRRDELAAFLIGRGALLSWETDKGTSAYTIALDVGSKEIAEIIAELMDINTWVEPVMAPESQQEILSMDNTPIPEEHPYLEVLSFGPRLKVYQCYTDAKQKILQESPLFYYMRFDGKPLGLIQEVSVWISAEDNHSHKRIIRSNHKLSGAVLSEEFQNLLEELRKYCREYGIEFLETNPDTYVPRKPKTRCESCGCE